MNSQLNRKYSAQKASQESKYCSEKNRPGPHHHVHLLGAKKKIKEINSIVRTRISQHWFEAVKACIGKIKKEKRTDAGICTS